MLEFDHAFVIIDDPGEAAQRAAALGLHLDAGQDHPGQGTRNRRLDLGGCYLELLWVIDNQQASRNAVRLDRRALCAETGASPLGLVFRGVLDTRLKKQYWLYDALGPRLWIHRDNETHPGRPLVAILEADDKQIRLRRERLRACRFGVPSPASRLHEMVVGGPSRPSVPPFAGPALRFEPGPHRLTLVLDESGSAHPVTDECAILMRTTEA